MKVTWFAELQQPDAVPARLTALQSDPTMVVDSVSYISGDRCLLVFKQITQ